MREIFLLIAAKSDLWSGFWVSLIVISLKSTVASSSLGSGRKHSGKSEWPSLLKGGSSLWRSRPSSQDKNRRTHSIVSRAVHKWQSIWTHHQYSKSIPSLWWSPWWCTDLLHFTQPPYLRQAHLLLNSFTNHAKNCIIMLLFFVTFLNASSKGSNSYWILHLRSSVEFMSLLISS